MTSQCTFKQRQDVRCFYTPENNVFCARVQKSFGVCTGPCEQPCYSVNCLKASRGCQGCR